MEQFYQNYKSMLPTSNAEAMYEKMQHEAAQLRIQVSTAKQAGNWELALKLQEKENQIITNMRKWQSAIKTIPHKKLVSLYKESLYQEAGQPNLFELTLEAAASDNFVSAFSSMVSGSSSNPGPSRGGKRPIEAHDGVFCHSCGNEGHMVKDRLGNVVCPKELAKLEAHKKAKLN